MNRRYILRVSGICGLMGVVAGILAGTVSMLAAPAYSQAVSAGLITEQISDSQLVTLEGAIRPEATAANDRGSVPDNYKIAHIFLQLKHSPEREQALEKYLQELNEPKSPNYHKWLTPEQFGAKFGAAQSDVDKITAWLTSEGFTVNVVYPNKLQIDFSGTAADVRKAFHTDIHKLDVKGESHIANMSVPQIPAALAPAVVGIVSLNNFRPHPMYQRFNYAPGGTCGPVGGTCDLLTPSDLATIYNLNPVFTNSITGQGQTIAVVEDSDVFNPGNAICQSNNTPSSCCSGPGTGTCGTGDWDTFRSEFGLTGFTSGTFRQFNPAPTSGKNNCVDPGTRSGVDVEAILDAEWASAAAPNAHIVMGTCNDVTSGTFGSIVASGVFVALTNIVNGALTPAPNTISVSYGESEAVNGAAGNSAINSLYQQAATAGSSVFVSSGDSGSDANDEDRGGNPAQFGISVNGFGSTPNNVSVGGTDFGDTFAGTNSTYWNTSNTAAFGSAKSYIPEIPWNNSCASDVLAEFLGFPSTFGASGLCNSTDAQNFPFLVAVAGGSGGPSSCASGSPSKSGVVSGTCKGWTKPSFQSVFGNPSDSVRDLPDVALFAASGLWAHAYLFCNSNPADGMSCSGALNTWPAAGGTSFASPIMAGIQALVDERTGSYQDNPDGVYYALARNEYGASGNSNCLSNLGNGVSSGCVFYDINQGDNDEPCEPGSPDCFADGLTSGVGVLSTSTKSFQDAFAAGDGWDFVTGNGTVNAENLVMASAWPTPLGGTPTPTATSTSSGSPTPTATSTGGGSPTPTATATPTMTMTPTATATATPAMLEVTPPSKNFGNAKVGKEKKATFTLKNPAKTGPSIVFGSPIAFEVTPGEGFGFPETGSNNCPQVLAPKKKCKLHVVFAPTTPGSASATLTIIDNAGNANQTVPLSGNGE